MKNKRFAPIFATIFALHLLLLCGLIQNAAAQQGEIGFANGVSVVVKTEQNGESRDAANIYTSSGTDQNVVHRVMIDRKSKTYFGYDLEILPSVDWRQFEVSIKPLSIEKVNYAVVKIGDANDLSLRSLPKYPGKITIRSGDTIVLDILENPRTKEKISDSIKITHGKQKTPALVSDTKSAKDFTINNVQMSLVGFEAYLNEEKVKWSGGGMSGSVIWIYFPNKGRFILSPIAQSNAAFQKIGVIDGKTITFNYEGANYRFVSNDPVLTGGGKWNLWVMFDPDYKPASILSPETPFSFGAANKVEYLFDNR